MQSIFPTLAAAVASFTSPSSSANDAGTNGLAASYGLQLQGTVAVNCNVRVGASQAPVQGALVDLGGMNEFCNSSSGYDVYVDFAPQMANAKLLIDGQPIVLSGSGSLKLAGEAGPALKSRSLQLDLSEAATADGALSFRIVPR